jgi:hypothetical protein
MSSLWGDEEECCKLVKRCEFMPSFVKLYCATETRSSTTVNNSQYITRDSTSLKADIFITYRMPRMLVGLQFQPSTTTLKKGREGK